jgi:hypothetical protein
VRPPIVLVAFESWNKVTDNALKFALSISPDVIGVHFLHLTAPDTPEEQRALREQWHKDIELAAEQAGLAAPRLIVLRAQYRAIQHPMLKVIGEIKGKFPGRQIAVLIPELSKKRWYQHLLHTHRAMRLRSRLIALGQPDLTVINVPWSLAAESSPLADRL